MLYDSLKEALVPFSASSITGKSRNITEWNFMRYEWVELSITA